MYSAAQDSRSVVDIQSAERVLFAPARRAQSCVGFTVGANDIGVGEAHYGSEM